MAQALDDWNSGDGLTAAHLQQAVRALRESETADGDRGGELRWKFLECFPATVTDSGPSGEADGTREIYWVQKSFFETGAIGDPLSLDPDEIYTSVEYPDNIEPSIYPATNLSEWAGNGVAGTHGLKTDGTVAVWVSAWYDRGDPQQKRYFFTSGGIPAPLLWGTLTADWAPGANTVTLQPCKAYNDTTSLKKADGVTPVDPVTCYIQFPTTAVTPCFQPLMSDNTPLAYRTDISSGLSYLVNADLWPVPQNQYEVILAISAVPPHWVNSYPLIHN